MTNINEIMQVWDKPILILIGDKMRINRVEENRNGTFNIIGYNNKSLYNVRNENFYGFMGLSSMTNMNDNPLRFFTNLDSNSRPHDWWFNNELMGRMHDVKTRYNQLKNMMSNVLEHSINPLHGDKYREAVVKDAEFRSSIQDLLSGSRSSYGGSDVGIPKDSMIDDVNEGD
jgi:hypothetical protein